MKIFIYTLAETVLALMVSVILAFCFSFAFLSVQYNLVFIVPMVMFARFYMLKSIIVPMQEQLNKLKKDNETKDSVIKKFVEDHESSK